MKLLKLGNTLIITVVFILILLALSLYYYVNNNEKEIVSNNVSNKVSKINKNNKIEKLIRDNERFMNIALRDLELLKNDTKTISIDENNFDENQMEIIKSYYKLLNEPTQKYINDWIAKPENKNNVQDNLNNMISNYNDFISSVENVLQETNYDLLRQLQKNYAIAHKVNLQRQIELENIDNLPQRFD